MESFLSGISRFCFLASYALAFALELLQALRARTWQRWTALAFGAAGLLAHTLFLLVRRPTIAAPYGSLLLLAWVVAIFYLYGTVHHRRLAWAVFVLPVVLLLILLSEVFPATAPDSIQLWFTGERFWGLVHGGLLFLAAIGTSVGCVASVMYLVQTSRVKSKVSPTHGMRLLSLERLALMNRRAIVWTFPLLTAGLLVGVVLLATYDGPSRGWTAPRVLSTAGLWISFLVMLYLRYGAQLSNKRLAVMTIALFALMLITLASAHPVVSGGAP
jgi:hypothetical protein